MRALVWDYPLTSIPLLELDTFNCPCTHEKVFNSSPSPSELWAVWIKLTASAASGLRRRFVAGGHLEDHGTVAKAINNETTTICMGARGSDRGHRPERPER